MNQIAGDILISHLRGIFTAELFSFTPQNLGLEQYSVEHWIGSHPDLKPCDAAPMNSISESSNEVFDFLWAQAPRRSSAPLGLLSQERETKVLEKPDIVLREYYYLAGNYFRWYKLYNKSPPSSSWIWQRFPNGEMWMDGVPDFMDQVL